MVESLLIKSKIYKLKIQVITFIDVKNKRSGVYHNVAKCERCAIVNFEYDIKMSEINGKHVRNN